MTLIRTDSSHIAFTGKEPFVPTYAFVNLSVVVTTFRTSYRKCAVQHEVGIYLDRIEVAMHGRH